MIIPFYELHWIKKKPNFFFKRCVAQHLNWVKCINIHFHTWDVTVNLHLCIWVVNFPLKSNCQNCIITGWFYNNQVLVLFCIETSCIHQYNKDCMKSYLITLVAVLMVQKQYSHTKKTSTVIFALVLLLTYYGITPNHFHFSALPQWKNEL